MTSDAMGLKSKTLRVLRPFLFLLVFGVFQCPTILFAQKRLLEKKEKVIRKADKLSVRFPSMENLSSIDSLQQRPTRMFESARTRVEFGHPIESQSIDTLKRQLDSLGTVKSPDTVVTKYLVSMKARSDSLQNSLRLPPKTEKVALVQEKAREELNRLPEQVNEKLKLFSKQGANLGQLSDLNLQGFAVASIPGSAIPGVSVPSTSLPGSISTELPVTTGPTLGLQGVQSVNAGMPQLNTPSAPSIPDLRSEMSKAGEFTKPLGEINAASEQASEIRKNVKTIANGNLDSLDTKSVEASLASIGNAGAELTDAAKQAELVKKWNSDPMYQRELAVTMAKEQAVNHFAGHESELLSIMEQLSQAKGKVKDVEQVVDLFAKPTNPMKDKPFIERLRPGFNLQVQWNQIVLVDINPYVAYRLSGRWTTGIGWNERLGFSSDNYSFSSRDRIYGPRGFVHFKFKESNFLILSPEVMHLSVPVHTVPTGESTAKWVPGLMAGYRREFRYSKKVIGTFQLLYNLVAPVGQSPYASRFNVLFGFEFPLKKLPKA